MKQPRKERTTRGFSHAATLMQTRIRTASESRGFAVSRLLTHWAEIVGEGAAKVCNPVKVSYSQGGLGATLTVLTTGAQAPMLEMQKEHLRVKVNACYGYNAIARIHITQTAPIGFAEGKAAFEHKPKTPKPPTPAAQSRARDLADGVADDTLRVALETLGANLFSKRKSQE